MVSVSQIWTCVDEFSEDSQEFKFWHHVLGFEVTTILNNPTVRVSLLQINPDIQIGFVEFLEPAASDLGRVAFGMPGSIFRITIEVDRLDILDAQIQALGLNSNLRKRPHLGGDLKDSLLVEMKNISVLLF